MRFLFLNELQAFINPVFLEIFVHSGFSSVLLNKSLSFQQKIRWIALLLKTRRNHRMSKLAAAITTKTIEENPVIIDIGANVGLFTKAFMKAPKTPKTIIAIEPSFYVFSILLNITANMPSVRCCKVALSHETATVDLKTPLKKSGFVETVEAKRLDDVLTDEKVNQVDIVKLDVEGAEEQVIAGAPNLFYNVQPIWFVELVQGRTDNFSGSAEKVFLNFIAAGYEAFVLNSDYEWDLVNKLSEHTDYLFVPTLSKTEVAVTQI
jgi:FkbM family methyltransferase